MTETVAQWPREIRGKDKGKKGGVNGGHWGHERKGGRKGGRGEKGQEASANGIFCAGES